MPSLGPEQQISVGFEKDRVGSDPVFSLDIRWWFYIWIPGGKLRNQDARLGVEDHGFTFARGGRTHSEEDAQHEIEKAQREAEREVEYWRGQPSHALGPNGELIPLGELAPELPA